jgi:hypothetical protein
MSLNNKSVLEIVEASLEAAESRHNLTEGSQEKLGLDGGEQLSLEELMEEDDGAFEAQIKAHNDALDGKKSQPESAANSSEDDLQDVPEADNEQQDGASESDVINDILGKPFLGFDNARSFMGNGQSMSGLIESLRKPPMRNAGVAAAFDNAMDKVGGEQNKLSEDQKISMGLGQAVLMMGGMGLLKLGSVIGKGGSFVGDQMGRLIETTQAKQLKASISGLDAQMDMLRGQGLGQLDDKGMTLAERQNLAKQYFSQPGNKQQLEQMFEQVDKLKQQARLMIEKGLKKGDSPDAVMDRVLEPVRRFTEQNEAFLESVKMGNETLLEKMDGAMNSLFEMLKRTFQRLASAMGGGSAAENGPKANTNSAPRLG